MPISKKALGVLKKELPETPRIVEIGAHQGDAVKQYLEIRPNAVIDAYEPDALNFEKLEEISGIYAYQLAVVDALDADIYTFFTSEKSNRCDSLFKSVMKHKDLANYKQVNVKPIGIDTVIGDKPDLVRLDCYGAEYVIFNNLEWHKNVRLIIIGFHVKPKPFSSGLYKGKRKEIISRLKQTHECIFQDGGKGKHIHQIWGKI